MPYRIFPRRLRERVGRRGLVLLLFGLAWLMQGAAHFLLGEMGTGEGFWHERLPVNVQGALWAVTGLTSIVCALMHRVRADTFGFLAVTAMPMFQGISYLVGAVTFALLGDPLWILGALGFSIWGVIALALGVVASWPETPTLPLVEGGDDE